MVVPSDRRDHAADVLLELGAAGLQEDHAGLHFGDDGPVVPQRWELPEQVSPTGEVELKAWFAADMDVDELVRAVTSRVEGRVRVTTIDDQDWNETWKRNWKPGRLCRRVVVVPGWEEPPELGDDDRVLRMDPGQAFGTGTHPSTRACAGFLDELLEARPGLSVLDVGTGTGVLAIAGLLLGASRAVGVDTDPMAVEAAIDNGAVNGVADRLVALQGSVDAAPDGRWDVVIANLLALLLVELAPVLMDRVAPQGTLLAAGILRDQAEGVVDAFAAAGASVAERRDSGEWVALRLELDR